MQNYCNFLYVNFKIAKNINDLEKRAEDAIKQIENKGYDMELKSEGYKNIIKHRISFYEKDCYVMRKIITINENRLIIDCIRDIERSCI